ncbi:hypothetical protein EDF74_1544 [Stenotrophomonas rhizophila]|uniref:hypothetical protein n=1 Tax=Stenotrophomonas rhizophila TaxID=216778 RepID=UPI000FA4A5F8|nr:hypothetical protein [Stenotrophomonas rhizophila]ROP80472.1 hypothetical protein EDF74_1544 [Stenotrophomonas rhizophila]
MVAVVQCSTALGSTLGGLLLDSVGLAFSFLASAGLLASAAVLAYVTAADAAAIDSAVAAQAQC